MSEVPSDHERLHFGGFMLDVARGRLLDAGGAEVGLRPKAFDLLVALARSPDRTLSKGELLDAVWGDIHVTEDSLFQTVREARRAIGDAAGQVLRSIPRRGYLLEAGLPQERAVTSPEPSPAAAEKPSIAVLPFATQGENAVPRYYADGLVEQITTALSRFRWLVVVASRSASAFQDSAADRREIGQALGVRYLLEGSVHRAGDRLRSFARLLEAATGRQVWADRFDSEARDIFDLQDRVTAAIAAALEPRLLSVEIERVTRKPTGDLDAYDLYLRALPPYYARNAASNAEAMRLLELALARDPQFHLARALLARCAASAVWLGGEPDHRGGTRRALDLARETLAADRTDPQILALCGHLLAVVGGEHEEAGALLDLSLRLNPNGADAWRLGGWVSVWSGDSEEALRRLAEAERLDPVSPLQADIHAARAAALLFARRFGEAAAAARRSLASVPEATSPRRFLAAALACAGEAAAARAAVAALLERQPGSSVARSRAINPFRHPWMTTLFLDGLREAGLPE